MVHRPSLNPLRQASLWDRFLALIGLRRRYRVEGHSMFPLLAEGDMVYAKPTAKISEGDVVVVKHPFREKKIIKQVKSLLPDGRITLTGLNHEDSEDSGSFGSLRPEQKTEVVYLTIIKKYDIK